MNLPTVPAESTLATKLTRAAVLAPLGESALPARTLRRVGEAISFGIFEVGEKLPPEAELAEQLGVSVMTLREALAILRESGYLETRRGRNGGTFVVARAKLLDRHHRLKISEVTETYLQDLTGYRLAIEGQCAALAAQQVTEEEVSELHASIDQMEAAEDLETFRKYDAAFHIGIASCTRSYRLARAETELQSELNSIIGLFEVGYNARHMTNDDHRNILKAIADGNGEEARSLMNTHVSSAHDAILGFVRATQSTAG
ncbi:FadR/GntR family transcriptional regulator [Rhodococcus wratislaviensis]|uniref:FadR/GntR family transcriptional regulator n=1 Tax=Rhodococcus wratislaviensis TaxID=44752 RepID=UPI00365880BE